MAKVKAKQKAAPAKAAAPKKKRAVAIAPKEVTRDEVVHAVAAAAEVTGLWARDLQREWEGLHDAGEVYKKNLAYLGKTPADVTSLMAHDADKYNHDQFVEQLKKYNREPGRRWILQGCAELDPALNSPLLQKELQHMGMQVAGIPLAQALSWMGEEAWEMDDVLTVLAAISVRLERDKIERGMEAPLSQPLTMAEELRLYAVLRAANN